MSGLCSGQGFLDCFDSLLRPLVLLLRPSLRAALTEDLGAKLVDLSAELFEVCKKIATGLLQVRQSFRVDAFAAKIVVTTRV